MQRSTLMLIAASLAAAPFAFAHTDQGGPGTPDFTCQTPSEWQVHDYAGANGRTVADISDNNLEECGTTYGLFIAGTPECRELEDRAGAGPGNPAWDLLCATDRPADFDGDLEFALGGALLAVDSGDGHSSGSLVCLGTVGHHGADIHVSDQVFGANVVFTVGADASLVPPPAETGEPDCGDNVTRPCQSPISGLGPVVDAVLALLRTGNCNPSDHLVDCFGFCSVPFGAGADGTYTVWVHPTATGGAGGSPTGASHGHVSTAGAGSSAGISTVGPLVLTVTWDGDVNNGVEWTAEGSFTCTLVDDHHSHFRVECTPDDVLDYHCVNPGVAVLHHQGYHTSRTRVDLDCGNITGGCESPFGIGSCVQYLGGDQQATLVCRGGYDFIPDLSTGTDYPPRYETACYSDPPPLPPAP